MKKVDAFKVSDFAYRLIAEDLRLCETEITVMQGSTVYHVSCFYDGRPMAIINVNTGKALNHHRNIQQYVVEWLQLNRPTLATTLISQCAYMCSTE